MTIGARPECLSRGVTQAGISESRGATSSHPAVTSGAGTAVQFPLTSALEVWPLPTAVPCARGHTKLVLAEWGLSALADDAALIVSELMTNACQASQALEAPRPIILRLLANDQCLLIEVWDRSPGEPSATVKSDDTEHGRGLMVIAALANRWGTHRTGAYTKCVWAELLVPRTCGEL